MPKPPDPPEHAPAEGFAGQSWFHEICGRTCAHLAIAKIEALLAQKAISQEQSESLLKQVFVYKGAVPPSRCPLLCARFIAVVKTLAFVQAPEDVYTKIFGAAVESWEEGLGLDAAFASQYRNASPPYSPVFNIPMFLQGLAADLVHVRKEALLAYSGFLRFRDVHTAGTDFDQAIDAFVKHVREVMTPADAVTVGRIALNFGPEVLGRLLRLSPAMALKHTKAVATLISTAILLDPAGAREDDKKPVSAALGWLADHIVQSGIPRMEKDRNTPEKGAGLREGVYKVLNDLWRNMEPSHRLRMEPRYSTLLPLLGGWDKRGSRLAAPGWWAWVSFEYAGQTWRIGGAVFDLCPAGRGFHITFTREVEDCRSRTDGGMGIVIVLKGGHEVPVEGVRVEFLLPDGSTICCAARARRGWKYEVKPGVYKDFCGAVFAVDAPADVDALKNRPTVLPFQQGMAPPPDNAPVPPARSLPSAMIAGPPSQPPQTQPPSPCAAGGGTQPPTASIPGRIAADTPSTDVPAAECYGEIDVLGDGQVVLTVFHAKPGPGQKPKVCGPGPLTKQEYRLLLAGIEDARNRYLSEKHEQPPDEMPFILEWKRNELVAALHDGQKKSFEELDQGERKALKSAVSRVRRLVNFAAESKCGLITEATRDGVRRTTIPIRLHKAGTPLGG